MSRDAQAVLLGPGYLYLAAWSSGAPETYTPLAETVVLTDSPGGNFADIGYSEEGWNLVATNEFSDWTPAELVDPITTVKDSQEALFRGVAAQFSLENLQIALGGGTITIESAGTPGTVDAIHKYVPPGSTDFTKYTALFRTETAGTNEGTTEARVRDFYVPYVVSMAKLDVPHNKGANPSLVALELKAFKTTGSDVFETYEQAQAV